MSRPIARSLAPCLLAGLLLCLASCAEANRPYPVRGKVLFDNKPAAGAIVTLVPLGDKPGSYRPAGVVGADGVFRLSTRGAFDGAPVGLYAVTIVYLSPATKEDDQNAGPDLLKGRYRDAATSLLRAEIKPADNELEPFRLEAK